MLVEPTAKMAKALAGSGIPGYAAHVKAKAAAAAAPSVVEADGGAAAAEAPTTFSFGWGGDQTANGPAERAEPAAAEPAESFSFAWPSSPTPAAAESAPAEPAPATVPQPQFTWGGGGDAAAPPKEKEDPAQWIARAREKALADKAEGQTGSATPANEPAPTKASTTHGASRAANLSYFEKMRSEAAAKVDNSGAAAAADGAPSFTWGGASTVAEKEEAKLSPPPAEEPALTFTWGGGV